MAGDYTVQDILGILWAAPFFIPVLLAPGYLLGVAGNILGFRIRGAAERILISLTLSCAISPYVINILCRFFPVSFVAIFFLLIGIAFLAVLFVEWRRARQKLRIAMHWTTKAAILLVALWGVICLLSLPDLQLGERIYPTAATWDHSVRSAFIASALRSGAPPANPFFYPGSPIHSRYYYYWNVLCAIPAYLSGASPRAVLYASCFWSGLCLVAVIPVYLKHFLEKESRLRLTTIFGFGLMAITGLDLIPTFVISLFHATPPYADMEWWDPVQVTSWLDSLLWVPHHVASLVACLMGFLLIWKAVAAGNLRSRLGLLALSAIGFSSAAGLSVYVTFTFALFLLMWVGFLLMRGKIVPVLLYCSAGLLAVLLSCGYLSDLLSHGATGGSGAASFVGVSLRQLPALFASFPKVLSRGNGFAEVCLQIPFIVLTLLLELGIYFIVAVVQFKHDWRHRRELSEAQKSLWFMALATLVVMILLRSTVIDDNDLAWRGSLVLQFVLLLWTAIYLADRVNPQLIIARKGWRGRIRLSKACLCLILIGGASSLYQLFMLRASAYYVENYGWINRLRFASGSEDFRIREAYDAIDRTTRWNAIVQFNPASKVNTPLVVYSRYQMVDAFATDCGTAFGGSIEQCKMINTRLNRIFDPGPGGNLSDADLARLCRSLKIDVLLVNAHDPVWGKADSWVWRTSPAFQNSFVRVYRFDSRV